MKSWWDMTQEEQEKRLAIEPLSVGGLSEGFRHPGSYAELRIIKTAWKYADAANAAEKRVKELEAKLERHRVLFEECWVCKGAFALDSGQPMPRCDDCRDNDEQMHAWDDFLYAIPCERLPLTGCSRLPAWHDGPCAAPVAIEQPK